MSGSEARRLSGSGSSDVPILSREDAQRQLEHLPGWTLEGVAIRKLYTFHDFPSAVAFVNRLVPEAEAADHHPDITINYRRVTLSFSTHSEGGLTQKDFDGAVMADRHASRS
jgi:4a-hydroxytetrahydrobiopterin dehydratase